MMKTKKKVKFELPYAGTISGTLRQGDELQGSSLPIRRMQAGFRTSRIAPILSPQRKARRPTRSMLNLQYNSLPRPSKLEIIRSASTNRSKSIAPTCHPDPDKTIPYLARSAGSMLMRGTVETLISSHSSDKLSPTSAILRPPRVNMDIRSIDFANPLPKSPLPIDIFRKFSTSRMENFGPCASRPYASRTFYLSAASIGSRDGGRVLPASFMELKLLRPHVSIPGVSPVTRLNSAYSDEIMSQDKRFVWVSLKFIIKNSKLP